MKSAAKTKTAYFCTSCGTMHPRWQGQCRACGVWNSLHEETVFAPSVKKSKGSAVSAAAVPIPEIAGDPGDRWLSGLAEFDRVVGGGLTPGSVLLVGGEPGIGKSSLLLQVAESLGGRGYRTLYVSGEESSPQIKARAGRFGLTGKTIDVANATELETILPLCRDDYQIIIIDSIQTMASSLYESPPGTVGQVRESAARLIEMAKRETKILFLVGHITKDGTVAGPKVLEHMVDTVLYFEGDRFRLYRILRSQKNRYGPAGEIGVFEMTGQGLREIANPSQIFMSGVEAVPSPGRVVAAAAEGSRSFLVEVEALVAASPYGTPQRVASGIDTRRLAIICAVLEKRGGILLGGSDIFVNIAGGIHLEDTALDLAFLIAAASSKLNLIVPGDLLVTGEIGLSGEVRGVSQIDRRLAEAARMGLKQAMIPKTNLPGLSPPDGMTVIPVNTVSEALEVIR